MTSKSRTCATSRSQPRRALRPRRTTYPCDRYDRMVPVPGRHRRRGTSCTSAKRSADSMSNFPSVCHVPSMLKLCTMTVSRYMHQTSHVDDATSPTGHRAHADEKLGIASLITHATYTHTHMAGRGYISVWGQTQSPQFLKLSLVQNFCLLFLCLKRLCPDRRNEAKPPPRSHIFNSTANGAGRSS